MVVGEDVPLASMTKPEPLAYALAVRMSMDTADFSTARATAATWLRG